MSEDCHDSDLLAPEHPSLRCIICSGPIGTGEPVTYGSNPDGSRWLSHRFISDCEWHADPSNLAKQDAEFLRELGIQEAEPPMEK